MMKAVLFDVDNTLYDTQQYFLGAFSTISKYISAKYSIPQHEVYTASVELWKNKTSMYPHLFDDLLNLFHLDQASPQAIVNIFNACTEGIEVYPDAIPTLQTLKERDYKLGTITDVNKERQKRKIESLKLEPFFDVIIYTQELESKPSSLPFITALEKLGVNASSTFYVADNPLIDFEGAKRVGISTIRILRGEFTKIPRNKYIDFETNSLDKILDIV